MKIKDLVAHARSIIPMKLTDFGTRKTITSATVASDIMTVTIPSHQMSVGEVIQIEGMEFRHDVTITNKAITTAEMASVIKTDLTTPYNSTVTLESNEADYNGDFSLLLGGKNSFQIKVALDAPDSTVETITLVEKNLAQINNTFTVASVVDTNTITVSACFPDTSAITLGEAVNLSKVRISCSVAYERFLEAYTKQGEGEYYLAIIAGDSTISRSRDINTDFAQRLEEGTGIQIDTKEDFSVFAFIPTHKETDPVDAQDYCRHELKAAILSTFLGFIPDKEFSAKYDGIFYQSDGAFDYNKALYVHKYDFSCTLKINTEDSYNAKSIAISKITSKFFKDADLKATDIIVF